MRVPDEPNSDSMINLTSMVESKDGSLNNNTLSAARVSKVKQSKTVQSRTPRTPGSTKEKARFIKSKDSRTKPGNSSALAMS